MKEILRIFAFCVAFMSSGELVHAQVFVKTDAVKSVWSDYDFNEQGTTLESVIVFCMNKSGATISDCREKVKRVVAKHNQTLKESKSVQVPLSNEKSNSSENKISQIIITRDLDGGTRVSGNCDNEIVIKYGTRVTLDCDAVKNEKNLTGYIDQDGHEMSKNSFFSFAEPGYTELTIPGTKSLKAVYGGSETQERVIDNVHDNDRNLIELNNWETRAVQPAETPEIVNDVEQNKSTETKEHSYQCTGVSRTLSSAAEAQTPDELDCVSRLRARKVCQGNHNMLGINKVCDANTRKCVYACMLNKMDFHNRKYKTICCNVSSSSDDVNCAWGRKEGNYTDVEGPGAGELSVQGC